MVGKAKQVSSVHGYGSTKEMICSKITDILKWSKLTNVCVCMCVSYLHICMCAYVPVYVLRVSSFLCVSVSAHTDFRVLS